MSKVSKSFLSFVLVICLMFSTCSVAFAASDIGQAKEKKTVIVVPGLLGSELFSAKNQFVGGEYFKEDYRFWVPECLMPFVDEGSEVNLDNLSGVQISSIKRDLDLIACDSNGKSKVAIKETNPIMDCRNNPEKRNFGTGNFYNKLVKNLVANTDESEYNIIFFSYDWRLSSKQVAENLETFVNSNGLENITLISHSMGGLVCASYLSNPKNVKLVDKTISLGSPFLGSPRAFSAIDYGKFVTGFLGFLSSPIIRPTIKSVAENCPSIYELLPPKQYFDYSNQGYLNKPNINICLPYRNISTYEETTNYILKTRKWPKGAANLLSRAQDFYDTLYSNGKFVYENENIKIYNIVGFGSETIDQFDLFRNAKLGATESYTNGDDTVSVKSAMVGHSLDKKDNYYVKDVSHMNLVTNKVCLNMVSDLLKDKTSPYDKGTGIIQRTRPSEEI